MSEKDPFERVYDNHAQYKEDHEYRTSFTFGALFSYLCVCLTFFALGALVVEHTGPVNEVLSLLGVGLVGGLVISGILAYGIGGTPRLKARYNAVWARKHALEYHEAVAEAEQWVNDARTEVRLLD